MDYDIAGKDGQPTAPQSVEELVGKIIGGASSPEEVRLNGMLMLILDRLCKIEEAVQRIGMNE